MKNYCRREYWEESFMQGIEDMKVYLNSLVDGITFHKAVAEGFLVSADKHVYIMNEDGSLSYSDYLTVKYLDDVL